MPSTKTTTENAQSLRLRVRELENEVEYQNGVIKEAEDRNRDLENQLSSALSDVTSLESRNTELCNKSYRLKQRVEDLSGELASKSEAERVASLTLSEKEEEIEGLNDKLDQMRQTVTIYQAMQATSEKALRIVAEGFGDGKSG